MDDIVKKIEVLKIHKDDLLVLTCKQILSIELAERLKNSLEKVTGLEGNRILILDHSMELSVMRKIEQ